MKHRSIGHLLSQPLRLHQRDNDWQEVCILCTKLSIYALRLPAKFSAYKAARWLDVARTVFTPRDLHVLECKVCATPRATKYVVVVCARLCCAMNVGHQHVGNDDSVAWVARWAAIEVILLDIDAVDGNVGDEDVLIGNADSVISMIQYNG